MIGRIAFVLAMAVGATHCGKHGEIVRIGDFGYGTPTTHEIKSCATHHRKGRFAAINYDPRTNQWICEIGG